MKHLLLTTIAAVVLVGCGESSSLEADKALLHSGAGKGSIEAAENAIAAGANVNYIDLYGYTPLHVAVNRGDKIMTELLIDNGADLDAKDSKLHAESPLFHALNASHIEITQLLIDVFPPFIAIAPPPNASPSAIELLLIIIFSRVLLELTSPIPAPKF